MSILELLDLSTSSAAEKPAASYRPSQAATSEARDTSSRSPLRCPRCAEINQSFSPYLSHILDIHFVEYQEKAPKTRKGRKESTKSQREWAYLFKLVRHERRDASDPACAERPSETNAGICVSQRHGDRAWLPPIPLSPPPPSLPLSLSEMDGFSLSEMAARLSLSEISADGMPPRVLREGLSPSETTTPGFSEGGWLYGPARPGKYSLPIACCPAGSGGVSARPRRLAAADKTPGDSPVNQGVMAAL